MELNTLEPDNTNIDIGGDAFNNMQWKHEHEHILSDWGDKAMCYRWLHSKSHVKFNRLNALYTIPVIVISTITGTANFAQDKFSGSTRELVVMLIGSFNIIGGLIQTIQQFLKISEYNEAHRVSSIAWDKFNRNIKVELAKSPDERIPVAQMLKISKEEFDRLTETSPRIPEEIIKNFMKTGNKNKESFKDISKPEICGDLVSTKTFKYKERIKFRLPHDIKDADGRKAAVMSFIREFNKIKSRIPSIDEIYDNLQESLQITKEEIQEFINDFSEA